MHGTHGEVVAVRAERDRSALLELPPSDYLVVERTTRVIARDGFFSFEGRRYHVPDAKPGERVELVLGAAELEVYSLADGRRIEAKLGHALRRLPSGDINTNRLWMTAVTAALNLSAMLCDLSPLAGASGQASDRAPLRRHAKTLRRALLCVPARITRHARQTVLRFAAGYRHLDALEATWAAAYALPPP